MEKKQTLDQKIAELQSKADDPRAQMDYFLNHSSEFVDRLFGAKEAATNERTTNEYEAYADDLAAEMAYFIRFCTRAMSDNEIQKISIKSIYQKFPVVQVVCGSKKLGVSLTKMLRDCPEADKTQMKEMINKAENSVGNLYFFCAARQIQEVFSDAARLLRDEFPTAKIEIEIGE